MSNEAVRKGRFFSPWFYLGILCLANFLCGFNTGRLLPIIPRLLKNLNIDIGQAGVLMSSSTILNIFITVPLGFFIAKIGVVKGGYISIIALFAGSLIGSFFNRYFFIFAAQLIGGIGYATMAVTGPTFINMLFDRRRVATAMGFFMGGTMMGQFLAFLLLPLVTSDTYIASAWLGTFCISIITILLWVFFIKKSLVLDLSAKAGKNIEAQGAGKNEKDESGNAGEISSLKNKKVWQIVAGAFFCIASVVSALSFLTAYLVEERGMSLELSSSLVGFAYVVGFAFAITAGRLSDKFQTFKWVYFASTIVMVLLRIFQVTVPNGFFLCLIVVLQGIPALGTPILYSAVQTLVSSTRQKTIAVSMITTGSICGTALAPICFGYLVKGLGYFYSSLLLVPVSLLALIGMMTVKEIK
jgi:MFS family permease